MAFTPRFDTPARLRDLPDGAGFYDQWHGLVAGLIQSRTPGCGTGEFLNPSEWNLAPSVEPNYSWIGFPRPHLVENRDDRAAAFAAGESRDAQHEYLEWHVTRVGGKITKVVFVTETPEYWTALATAAPDRVHALYQELLGLAVAPADLFGPDGKYIPRNRWNDQDGIVHYIMSINSLEALLQTEQFTVKFRVISETARDNYDGLPLRLGPKRQPIETASDARMALDIGPLSRRGLSITAREPIGIYMVHWDDTGWAKPDGTPVGDYWRVTRGQPGAALRLEYEVPEGEGFAVGDITIGGRPITTGGQLAEHIALMAGGVAGTRAP